MLYIFIIKYYFAVKIAKQVKVVFASGTDCTVRLYGRGALPTAVNNEESERFQRRRWMGDRLDRTHLVSIPQLRLYLLLPCVFLVLGSTPLNGPFPDSFSQNFGIISWPSRRELRPCQSVRPDCQGIALIECVGSIIADVVGVWILEWKNMGPLQVRDQDGDAVREELVAECGQHLVQRDVGRRSDPVVAGSASSSALR